MPNGILSKRMCKWMMNLGAKKNMTLHKTTFNSYEVITPHNVHLHGDNAVETIQIHFIIMNPILRDKSTKFVSKMCSMCPNCKPVGF